MVMPLAANAAHGSVAACRPRLHQHLGLAAHSGHALAGPAAVPRPHNQRARSRRSTHHHATSQTVASPGTQPQAPHPLLTHGAPPEYDFRALTQPPSKAYVAQHWPELADLAEDGTLVVWQRPADYADRRAAEGYQEPLVVVMVGTAHVSERSAQDVDRVVRAVRPDAVVVELCRSRAAVMAEPQEGPQQADAGSAAGTPQGGANTGRGSAQASSSSQAGSQAGRAEGGRQTAGLGEAAFLTVGSGSGSEDDDSASRNSSNRRGSPSSSPNSQQPQAPVAGVLSLSGQGGLLGTLGRSASLGGQSAMLLRLLLSRVAKQTAGTLGVRGGGEFLSARRAAEAVGAQVVLGDRPIEITLQRAWDALPWGQRLKLCSQLLGASAAQQEASRIDAQALVERLKTDDALSAMLRALGQAYPQLLPPLVHERDAYLAWSLKRSKAVNGAKLVVGVMGAGHLRGVSHALAADRGGDSLRFSELVADKNRRSVRRGEAAQAAARLALDLALGTAAYLAWLCWGPGGGGA